MKKVTHIKVESIEEWKSVLNGLFKEGYEWASGNKSLHLEYFDKTGENFIHKIIGNKKIMWSSSLRSVKLYFKNYDSTMLNFSQYKNYISRPEKRKTRCIWF